MAKRLNILGLHLSGYLNWCHTLFRRHNYKLGLLLLVVFSGIKTHAQKGYIFTDSTQYHGVNISIHKSANTPQYIRAFELSVAKKFYPEEVREFGIHDGASFESRKIDIDDREKMVFLERLEDGSTKLFYFKDGNEEIFFLEKKGLQLTRIPNKPQYLESFLMEATNDFKWKNNQPKYVNFNKKKLTKFIELYNYNQNYHIPSFRLGINLGYGLTKLNAPQNSPNSLEGKTMNGHFVSVEMFTKIPFGISYFSLYSGMKISKTTIKSTITSQNTELNALLNYQTMSVPVLFNYTFPFSGFRPFINGGISYNYLFNKEQQLYETSFEENEVRVDEVSHNILLSQNMIGLEFGLGVEQPTGLKKLSSLEIKYHYLLGAEEFFGIQQLSLRAGFSINP